MSKMPPTAFIAMLLPAALACQREHGIPASFTIAQAALETGWGDKILGNNLFGIKADPSWKGPTVKFLTHEEYSKGQKTLISDSFRAYENFDACLRDRAGFFRDNPRYSKCFAERTGPGWALAVAKAGFATDSNYAKTLCDIMRGRQLTQYDT
jgi:flagellum-specific peptidoglycan hydrolase FlgJ